MYRYKGIITVLMTSSLLCVLCDQDECQTLQTEVELVKQMPVEHQGTTIIVDCVATVTMNKCEGTCMSQVSPSVVHFPGLMKQCRCCQEGSLLPKVIRFEECFFDNSVVDGLQPSLEIQEPVDCSCQDCRN